MAARSGHLENWLKNERLLDVNGGIVSETKNNGLLDFWKSKSIPVTAEEERSILSGWRWLCTWATVLTPVAYFSVDLIHIPSQYHFVTGVIRGTLTIICLIYLIVSLLSPTFVVRHWRWGLRVVCTAYSLMMIWLEAIAIDPSIARYYIGLVQVAGAFMVMRITIEHTIILSVMTVIYVVVNYDSPAIVDAVFDLITFGSIFYVVIRNYKRIENYLETSLNIQSDIIATINHGWVVPFRAIARLAGILKEKVTGPHREMAETIEFQARFMHTEAKELIDTSRDRQPTVRPGRSQLHNAFDQARRTIEFIKHDARIEISQNVDDLDVAVSQEDLFRIFITLLSNSTNYSPDKRTQIVFESDAKFVTVRLTNQTRRTLDADTLFRKYKSLEPGGTGIGLYNIRTLAQLLGGEIRASIAPTSVTFILRLPVYSVPQAQPVDSAATP